jgi:hypothetical protein
VGRCGLVSSDSGYGPVVGSCEHGNEPSGFIKGEKFRDYVSLLVPLGLYSTELFN